MKITKTPISGLLLLQPTVFEDHRGDSLSLGIRRRLIVLSDTQFSSFRITKAYQKRMFFGGCTFKIRRLLKVNSCAYLRVQSLMLPLIYVHHRPHLGCIMRCIWMQLQAYSFGFPKASPMVFWRSKKIHMSNINVLLPTILSVKMRFCGMIQVWELIGE